MPPKQSAKLSEVKPRGKNGLELGPPSERDRSQSRERRKKKTARLELVAEVPDEQELETTLDEAEEVDNKFRSEADALLEGTIISLSTSQKNFWAHKVLMQKICIYNVS